MLFKDISILDENLDYQAHQWVGVENGCIAYLGDTPPADAQRYQDVYDGSNKLLMPALYNAHAHAPMTLLRGYAENLSLHAWLNDTVWPYEAQMTEEDNYWATLLACAEMARYGCVSFSDMYYHNAIRAKAIIKAGMKANLCTSPLAFEPKPLAEYPVLQEMEESVRDLHGSDEGRILIDTCIHAEYTNNDVTARDIIDWTRDHGLRLQIHLSETKQETEECRTRHDGKSPVQWFASLGAFEVPTTAAHCVWTDNEVDRALLRDNGVFVANNPASNLKLASGFAPIPRMLEEGITVCLGTDGMASNNNHDLFQDMYLMGLLYKGSTLDPTVVTPKEIVYAATRAGALSQGRENSGLVREGFAADLCVLDISGPSWCPMNDPLTNVVYAGHGSDVVLTLCDGRIIYQEGTWPTLDIECVKAQVSERTQRIQQQLTH